MEKEHTTQQVIAMLKKEQGERSLRGFARDLEVAPGYLSDVLNGRRDPGPAILKILNLKRHETVTYRKVA